MSDHGIIPVEKPHLCQSITHNFMERFQIQTLNKVAVFKSIAINFKQVSSTLLLYYFSDGFTFNTKKPFGNPESLV